MDLNYRREILDITHAELAHLLGRSIPTIKRWCSTSLEHPPWLTDWMEYVEMEISCGLRPQPIPRGGRKAVEDVLYPSRVMAKRPRRPNGSRAALLAARGKARTLRQKRIENAERFERNLRERANLPPMEPIERVDALLAKKNYIKTS